MTLDAFSNRLQGVRSRGPGKLSARCPSHDDRNPSLSVSEGERGILLRCFSGCSVDEICRALGLRPSQLFFDAGTPCERRAAAIHRAEMIRRREEERYRQGRLIDAVKRAERFIQSRRGVSIAGWAADQLNRELDNLATAYALCERDPYALVNE